MAPRGEVGMIIGLIGLNQGLINMGVYSAIILMCLITTIIPPLIMKNWIYKDRSKKEVCESPPAKSHS
jgi:Kef-type K+ transport system membrane component KefB